MTANEVKNLLNQHNKSWEDFCKWMSGQTVGVYANGEIDWYEWDVKRFINDLPNED